MNVEQKVAQRILNILGKFELDMSTYSSRSARKNAHLREVCGTTFCLLGYLAYEDGYPATCWTHKGTFDYGSYSKNHLGMEEGFSTWEYLFGMRNPNTFESAKERAEYVLEHGHAPAFH